MSKDWSAVLGSQAARTTPEWPFCEGTKTDTGTGTGTEKCRDQDQGLRCRLAVTQGR